MTSTVSNSILFLRLVGNHAKRRNTFSTWHKGSMTAQKEPGKGMGCLNGVSFPPFQAQVQGKDVILQLHLTRCLCKNNCWEKTHRLSQTLMLEEWPAVIKRWRWDISLAFSAISGGAQHTARMALESALILVSTCSLSLLPPDGGILKMKIDPSQQPICTISAVSDNHLHTLQGVINTHLKSDAELLRR